MLRRYREFTIIAGNRFVSRLILTMSEYIFSATLNSIFNLNHNKQLMANLSCCTFAIKLYSVKNRGRVGSGGNFDKRCDIRRKWNVPFSCFWKFRPLDCLDSLREEIRGQKESRQMKISIAASRAQANSPPLVERETRWNITKVFLGSRARALFFPRSRSARRVGNVIVLRNFSRL